MEVPSLNNQEVRLQQALGLKVEAPYPHFLSPWKTWGFALYKEGEGPTELTDAGLFINLNM